MPEDDPLDIPTARPSYADSVGSDYARHRTRMAERSRRLSAAGRDIGPPPPVVNPERRAKSKASLLFHIQTYHAASAYLEMTPLHREFIADLERTVRDGGSLARAYPRGFGKSFYARVACMWAVLHGYRKFAVIVGATSDAAGALLEATMRDLEMNEMLFEDFPEACHPIRALGGDPRRCRGQLMEGESTKIEVGKDQIKFATVPGAACSRSIIYIAGITSAIRGKFDTDEDGRQFRPDLALIDDPQTRESAASPSQCDKRRRIITQDVRGLAGPDKTIASLAMVTIVVKGDLADQLTDRERSPSWRGGRHRLVESMPEDMALWEKYAEIRRDDLVHGGDGSKARAFYLENREAMDAGCVHNWPERFDPSEFASAIEQAVCTFLDDPAYFHAELQNDPIDDLGPDTVDRITEDVVLDPERLNGCKRRVCPEWATKVTAFVDVQEKCLWYAVVAWGEDFTGAIIDYGAWPEQPGDHYTLSNIKRTLGRALPGAGLEARWHHGLTELCGSLSDAVYEVRGGGVLRLDRGHIDAAYGKSTEVVRAWCAQSEHGSTWAPSFGRAYAARGKQINEQPKKPGDRTGYYWRIPKQRGVRHVLYDANHWKSFIAARLRVRIGDPGSLTLWGARRGPRVNHRMIAEHVCAERPVRVEASTGTVKDEWTAIPGKDNHLFDCLVGAACAASVVGVTLPNAGHEALARGSAKRKRISTRELRERKKKR